MSMFNSGQQGPGQIGVPLLRKPRLGVSQAPTPTLDEQTTSRLNSFLGAQQSARPAGDFTSSAPKAPAGAPVVPPSTSVMGSPKLAGGDTQRPLGNFGRNDYYDIRPETVAPRQAASSTPFAQHQVASAQSVIPAQYPQPGMFVSRPITRPGVMSAPAAQSAGQPAGPGAPDTPPAQAHPAFNPVTGPAVNPGDQAQRMSWAAQSSYRPMADAEVAQYDALMARQHQANEQSIAATGAPQWSPRPSPWSGGAGVPIQREGAMTQYVGGNQDPAAALAHAAQSARTPEELIALSNASTGREHAAAQAEMYRGEAAKNFEQAKNPMGLAPGIDPHAVTEAKLQMAPGSSTHHDYNDVPSLDAWSRQAQPTVSGMRGAIAGGGLNQHDPRVMAMIKSMLSTKFPDLSGTYHENDGGWFGQSEDSRQNQELLKSLYGPQMFAK